MVGFYMPKITRKTVSDGSNVFFKKRKRSDSNSCVLHQKKKEPIVLIPDQETLQGYQSIPTGCGDRQSKRMAAIASEMKVVLSVKKTNAKQLPLAWQRVFQWIDKGQAEKAIAAYERIEGCLLKDAVTYSHSPNYIAFLIKQSAELSHKDEKEIGMDVLINKKTLQSSITDLYAIQCAIKEKNSFFSLSLPGHHAFYDAASGFCLLNSTVIIAWLHQHCHKGIVHIVGVDVNQDNGIKNFYTNHAPYVDVIQHTDFFSYGVYPVHASSYEEAIKIIGLSNEYKKNQVTRFKKREMEKHSESLSVSVNGYTYQPIFHEHYEKISSSEKMNNFCEKLMQSFEGNKDLRNNDAIIVSLGIDSHQEEEAACAVIMQSDLESRYPKKASREMIQKGRFSTEDFLKLADTISLLKETYGVSIYIVTEGGYTPKNYPLFSTFANRTFSPSSQYSAKKDDDREENDAKDIAIGHSRKRVCIK